MKNKFCCKEIEKHVNCGDLPITYIARDREYGINYQDGGTSFQLINYCPWCRKKLPKKLGKKWFDELEKLGYGDPLDDDADKIPEEFKSDKWWKMRGL